MELLSIKQIASKLGYTRQRIWQIIKSGKLRATLIGKTYVVHVNEFKEYVQEKRGESV